MLALLTPLVAFRTWTWLTTPTEPHFDIDSALMEQTTAQLREVAGELRTLPLPAGAEDEGTRQVGCGEDSGDVFQPAAVRHWKVRASDTWPAAAAVAEAMLARGWTGSTVPNPHGSYFLVAERGPWSARAVLGSSEELVYLEAVIRDAGPCRLPAE